jgi:RNA polymerase sigma factor (sigma-70 family)
VAGEEAAPRDAVPHDAGREARPSGPELVRLARERLAQEVASLPPWGSPLLWARLCVVAGPQAVSLGALAHYLRIAVRRGDAVRQRDLFTLLLRRVEAGNRHWAERAVRRTAGLRGAEAEAIRDDLLQELALRLWTEVGRGAAEGWELFFSRALAYAQRHTAAAYMEQRGYWVREGVARPNRVLPQLLARLRMDGDDGEESAAGAQPADQTDHFSAAELADLRAQVLALPERERVAVVLRYWQQAREDEIAAALGVTTRSVRNYLRGAYDRLRDAYGEVEGGEA